MKYYKYTDESYPPYAKTRCYPRSKMPTHFSKTEWGAVDDPKLEDYIVAERLMGTGDVRRGKVHIIINGKFHGKNDKEITTDPFDKQVWEILYFTEKNTKPKQEKETMNTLNIERNITLINDKDSRNFSNLEIIDLIRVQKGEVASLVDLNVKSLSINKKIDERNNDIKELVKVLDSRLPKEN